MGLVAVLGAGALLSGKFERDTQSRMEILRSAAPTQGEEQAQAQAAELEGEGQLLVSDFESGDTSAAFGQPWEATTDAPPPVTTVSVAGVVETLRAHGAMEYTIVVLAGSADPMTVELKGVELVLLSSTLCLTNVGLLRSAAEARPPPQWRAAALIVTTA